LGGIGDWGCGVWGPDPNPNNPTPKPKTKSCIYYKKFLKIKKNK